MRPVTVDLWRSKPDAKGGGLIGQWEGGDSQCGPRREEEGHYSNKVGNKES